MAYVVRSRNRFPRASELARVSQPAVARAIWSLRLSSSSRRCRSPLTASWIAAPYLRLAAIGPHLDDDLCPLPQTPAEHLLGADLDAGAAGWSKWASTTTSSSWAAIRSSRIQIVARATAGRTATHPSAALPASDHCPTGRRQRQRTARPGSSRALYSARCSSPPSSTGSSSKLCRSPALEPGAVRTNPPAASADSDAAGAACLAHPPRCPAPASSTPSPMAGSSPRSPLMSRFSLPKWIWQEYPVANRLPSWRR